MKRSDVGWDQFGWDGLRVRDERARDGGSGPGSSFGIAIVVGAFVSG